MDKVKFVALDPDDLEVVSAHLQDAIVRVSDILWRPQEKRLVMAINRFDWLAAEQMRPELKRCRSALRFERVKSMKCRNIDPTARDQVLNLLAVEFEQTDPPGGCVKLIFSDDITLRLDVECLEVELADIGPAWSARARPVHIEEQHKARD
jgi:hypothetical protein